MPRQTLDANGRPPKAVWDVGVLEKGPNGDLFRLQHDGANLYFAYTCRPNGASMANKGTDPATLFETGGAWDLMLQTAPRADPARKSPARGDVRLLFAEMGGKAVCVKYDYDNPAAPPSARRVFESPVGKFAASSVAVEPRVTTWIEKGGLWTVRAVIPFEVLGWKRAPAETRADVGRVNGDPAGATAVRRDYWSNKATSLMSDRPSQAGVEPRLWGTFRFD